MQNRTEREGIFRMQGVSEDSGCGNGRAHARRVQGTDGAQRYRHVRIYNQAMEDLRSLPYWKVAAETLAEEGDDGEALAQMRKKIRRVERAFVLLTEEERTLLLRLLSGETGVVEDICYENNCDKSTVYRLRQRALKKMALAMYGRAE